MDYQKEKKGVIKSAQLALKQLDKLITQDIDLSTLDPEKAKAAAQGKIEAIEGSFRIISRIEEEMAILEPKEVKKDTKSFGGVESFIKKNG